MLDKVSPQSMADEHLLPAALLEMGDSLNFIEVRKHTLRKEIKDSKLSAAAGKFSGLGAIAGGAALAALSNPLGWLIGGCGITAYTLSVFGQWLQTGKVHPMPLSSKSQDERDEDLADQTVSGESENSTGRTAIHEEAAYLSDREKTEYELLHFAPQGLMSAMNNVPPAQRWACYQFLVDAFNAGTIKDYANPQTLKDVLGNPSVYSSHLPEAAKRFPQYGLPAVETSISMAPYPVEATDSGPAIATSSPIGNTTRLGAVEVSASPAGETRAPNPGLFDFNSLRTEPDNYTGFAIVGDMGTGKTRLIKYLARNILTTGRMSVMDIYARNHDWQGASVLTTVDDFLSETVNELEEIDRLTEAYRNGQTMFQPHLFVLEEAADTLSEASDQGRGEAKIVARWLSKYLTITRKIGKRLCLVSVNIKDLTDAIGSAEKRNSMVFIFPGRAAIAKAMTDTYIFKLGTAENRGMREKLEKSIALIKRPALIQHRGQWWVAEIPEVNEDGSLMDGSSPEIAATVQAPEPRPISKATPQDLERMFAAPSAQHESADHEVEEEEIEQQDTTAIDIKELFPHWNEKMISVAVKVLIHLRSKGTLKAYEIKSATAELRAADRTKTDKLLVELLAKNLVQVADGNYSAIAPSADSLDELDW